MPFAESAAQLASRQILIEPEYGYGWLLVGRGAEPIEIKMPEPFKGVVSNALFASGVAHAITAHCKADVASETFCWVGLMPRTDSIVDLAVTGVFCSLILSSTVPLLAQQDLHPELKYLRPESKAFVRGSARLSLLPRA